MPAAWYSQNQRREERLLWGRCSTLPPVCQSYTVFKETIFLPKKVEKRQCVCCLVVDLIQMTFPSQRCDFFMFPLPQKLKARARGLSPDIRQIDLDVNRTYRDHIMFMHRYDVKYETPILPKNLWVFFSKMVTCFWFYFYVDCFVFVCFSGSRLFFMSSLPTPSTTQ